MTPVGNKWYLPEAASTEGYRGGMRFVGNQIDARLLKPTRDDIVAGLNWFANAAVQNSSGTKNVFWRQPFFSKKKLRGYSLHVILGKPGPSAAYRQFGYIAAGV
jgi:hypothetical protein